MHDLSRDDRVIPVVRTRNPIPDEVIRHHVRVTLGRGLPELEDELEPHDRTMVVVGSGPSIRELPPAYADAALPYDIFALGGAHDWLIERGVVPHGWVNSDPLPMIADYVRSPHPEVTYYLASQSHRFVFDAVDGFKTLVWHNNVGAGTERVVAEARGGGLMIAGGPTTATRAPFLGHALGYRKFVFYGCDGSGGYVAKGIRPYADMGPDTLPRGMFHQASAFETILREFPEWDIEIRGSGFMNSLWRQVRGDQTQLRS